ncbi:uncharacterized protein ColSpa_08021 [Colletotrichum spaethianum]|uniref:Uncharacterized protein n=1 Tax=Colletotrichum spaethianum TaxID=700344 RepID=A0AA37P8Y1_9PEZI|nr:uncharacterized protein ColSpa_08021 [Colletotrichum spaethianum]GKT47840.1 hypothetical protein ColSpa_08021 [Colletotrichum spaethianum]
MAKRMLRDAAQRCAMSVDGLRFRTRIEYWKHSQGQLYEAEADATTPPTQDAKMGSRGARQKRWNGTDGNRMRVSSYGSRRSSQYGRALVGLMVAGTGRSGI